MNYLSNATTSLSTDSETGALSLVGTCRGEETRDDVIENLKSNIPNIATLNSHLSFENTAVEKVGAKVIFISTKFAFFERRKNFKKDVDRVCKENGLIPIWGDPQFNSDIDQVDDLSRYIIERIQKSQAFLLIIPETAEHQEWILFEWGIACGSSLKRAICVEEKRVQEYLKVASGWPKYTFDSSGDDDQLIDSIRPAISKLAGLVYGS